MLLPSRSAPISRSRLAMRCDTRSASRLPCFESRSMLPREAPVSTVSLAAKKAEAPSSAAIMQNVSQSMAWLLCLAVQLRLQEVPNPRRIDVLCDDGAADGLEQ